MRMKAGRIERLFEGMAGLNMDDGGYYTLTREAGSYLCRYGGEVPFHPAGTIRRRSDHFEITIPEGVFFVYQNHLRETIQPKGRRNFANVYVKSVSPCQEV